MAVWFGARVEGWSAWSWSCSRARAWWCTWTWLWLGEEEEGEVVVLVLRRVALVVAEWVSGAEELASGVVAWAWEVEE